MCARFGGCEHLHTHVLESRSHVVPGAGEPEETRSHEAEATPARSDNIYNCRTRRLRGDARMRTQRGTVVKLNRVMISATVALLLSGGQLVGQEISDLPAQDRSLNANFEEVFSVGSFDGEEWETFGEIGGLAFDAGGRLYIFDQQSSRVVVVDDSGQLVREIGQPGEGPGELRMPLNFTVLRDGTTVIADMGHRAYSIFGADGEYDRMVTMGGGGGMIRLGELQADPTGMAIFSGGGGMRIQVGPGAGPEPTTRPIERIVLQGEDAVAETVAEGWLPPPEDQEVEMSGGGMQFSMSAGPRVFEPGLHTGVLPNGGLVYADTSTYDVKVVDADGTLQRVLRRSFIPRPVTEAIIEAERERQLDELEEGGGPRMRIVTAGPGGQRNELGGDAVREMLRGRVEQMQFFHELPVIMGLSTGWEGTIWVQRRGEEPTEAGAIDLLKADGQYVGTFEAGETGVPTAFGPDGMAAFIETDEFDVPTVVVRRLSERIR